MPTKNDLSSIKSRNTSILKTAHEKTVQKPMVGRKPKPVHEKESKPVTLKFTEAEFKILKQNAGLVPLGTFIKEHIRNKTDLLKIK